MIALYIIYFKVEKTLYRIHRSVLSRHSPFFENLFALPAEEHKEIEGASDEIPLHLPHILVDQFDAFLSTVYPRCVTHVFLPHKTDHHASLSWRPQTHSTEALINILCLATKWEFAATRAFAIELLTTRSLSSVLRIELARAYEIPGWLLTAYVELARLRSPLSESDAERLGLSTVLKLNRARLAILRNRYALAMEMPKDDFFEIPVARHTSCWRVLSKALAVALRNGERGGSDEDLVEEVLTAFTRLQDEEPLCESCNSAQSFRARCGRWLDIDNDNTIVASAFNL